MNLRNTLARLPGSRGYAIAIVLLLLLAKSLYIYYGYQHIICEHPNGEAEICRGYAWKQLAENIGKGEYIMTMQTGIDPCLNMDSKSIRPPVYPYLLYGISQLGPAADEAAVVFFTLVTVLISVLGFTAVRRATGSVAAGILAFALLFLHPMNFLKAGSIDESPLMMMFVLTSFVLLQIAHEKGREPASRRWFVIISAFFIGLAIMTRYTALMFAAGAVVWMVFCARRNLMAVALYGIILLTVLSPWVYRNYQLYGDLSLSHGAARIMYITTTDEFRASFPAESIDDIERSALNAMCKEGNIPPLEDEAMMDRFFTRLAVERITSDPLSFMQSLGLKLYTALPLRVWPKREGDTTKNVTYILTTVPMLLLLVVSLRRLRGKDVSWLWLTAAMFYLASGLIYIMLTRHMYPVVIITIIAVSMRHADVLENRLSVWRAGSASGAMKKNDE